MNRLTKIFCFFLSFLILFYAVSPSNTALAGRSIKKRPSNSRLTGVTYMLDPDVVVMPKGIDYSVEEIPIDPETGLPLEDTKDINSMSIQSNVNSIERNVTIPNKTDKNINHDLPSYFQENETMPISLSVDKATKKALAPKIGKIYINPVTHEALKVTDNPVTDSSGMTTIPVEEPKLEEVIQTLNIPKQTVKLSNSDIGYVNPEITIEELSGKQVNAENTIQTMGFVPSTKEPMVTIDLSGLTLIDESTDKDNKEEDAKKEKEIKDKEKQGIYQTEEEKEQAKKEKEQLEEERKEEWKYSANVEIKEGYLKIYEPTLTTYADYSFVWLNCGASVNFDMEADYLIEGNLTLKREVEILLYGYDLNFEIGKIYAGVYLVIGLDGKIDFEIRVQQFGTANIGVKGEGVGIPQFVTPDVSYNNKTLETEMSATGELKVWAYGMPKAGIELFGFNVLSANLKIGVEANVTFDINEEYQTAHLWIDLIFRIKACALGWDINILDKKINLYDRVWTHSSDAPIEGSSGGIVKQRRIVDLFLTRADAVRDVIQGSVSSNDSPCSGEVVVQIKHADGAIDRHVVPLKSGEFNLLTPITPLDMICVDYDGSDISYIYHAETPYVNVQPPYIFAYLTRDAFNNKIFGEIAGEVYGPNSLACDGDEVKFKDPINIYVQKKGQTNPTKYTVTPNQKAEFSLENVPLEAGDKVYAELTYENAVVSTENLEPRLGLALKAELKKNKNEIQKISGVIQNLYGIKQYTGDVKLYSGDKVLLATVKAKAPENASTDFPSTIFEFTDIASKITFDQARILGLNVVIEYNGIKLARNVVTPIKLEVPRLEAALVSPAQAYIDSIINPVTIKSMESIINKSKSQFQNPEVNVNTGQNNGIYYSMSNIPMNDMNEPKEYHFDENAIELSAKSGTGNITLTWNPSFDTTQVQGYKLYRGTKTDEESLSPITGIISDCKYIDKNVDANTTYYYLCSVVYKNGDEFIISNEASAKPRRRNNRK